MCVYLVFLCLSVFPFLGRAEEPKEALSITLNDAIILTLANQREIGISILNVKKQVGVLQQSGGPFDPVFSESAQDTGANSFQKNPNSHWTANECISLTTLTKQTRPGTSFTLTNQVESFKSKIGNTRASQLWFQIDQPLLKNFLNGLNRQIEKSNELELEATRWDTLQTISLKILNTVVAYWEVAANQASMKTLTDGIQRLNHLKDLTQRLIEGEELAASDIQQPEATLKTEMLYLLNVENNLYAAKQQLLFAMGVVDEEACEFLDKEMNLLEELPTPSLNGLSLEEKRDFWTRMALDRRFDILASYLREEKAEALVVGAENQTLPTLDVFGSVTVNDLYPYFQTTVVTTGVLLAAEEAALNKNYSTNLTIGLNFSMPLYNDSALGFLKQQEAILNQTRLKTQLLKQNVITLLNQTIHNQVSLIKRRTDAEELVKKLNLLVQNETEKLESGFSTVFVLLEFETRLIHATLDLIQIIKLYDQGLANLRYLTNTLIDTPGCFEDIKVEDVTTYPFESPSR